MLLPWLSQQRVGGITLTGNATPSTPRLPLDHRHKYLFGMGTPPLDHGRQRMTEPWSRNVKEYEYPPPPLL